MKKVWGMILGGILAIAGLIILFLHLLPEAANQAQGLSGNLTANGVSTEGAQWYVWIFWGVLTLVTIGIAFKLAKQYI